MQNLIYKSYNIFLLILLHLSGLIKRITNTKSFNNVALNNIKIKTKYNKDLCCSLSHNLYQILIQ